jgi:hypothetical protein
MKLRGGTEQEDDMKFGSDQASHEERCSQGHSSGYITNATDREKRISLAAMIVGKENVQDRMPSRFSTQ